MQKHFFVSFLPVNFDDWISTFVIEKFFLYIKYANTFPSNLAIIFILIISAALQV
jgi:hypothetical protein